jgi:predicted nuclease of predicted toxin-antitoxin system
LPDECAARHACLPVATERLEAHGHEDVHAHEIGLDPAADREVLAVARRENRVVITADLDFPRLLALSSAEGPGLILFRGGNYSDAEMRDLLDRVLTEVPPEILETSICVVDRKRIRHTRLPLEQDR